MLNKRATNFGERMRRVMTKLFGRLRVALQTAAEFYFKITRRHDRQMAKYEVANRLLHIAPHFGVALLVMLADAWLITEARKEVMRREQMQRHLAGDTSTHVYEIEPNASSRPKQCIYYQTVSGFLGADDDTLEARFRFAECPAYE